MAVAKQAKQLEPFTLIEKIAIVRMEGGQKRLSTAIQEFIQFREQMLHKGDYQRWTRDMQDFIDLITPDYKRNP